MNGDLHLMNYLQLKEKVNTSTQGATIKLTAAMLASNEIAPLFKFLNRDGVLTLNSSVVREIDPEEKLTIEGQIHLPVLNIDSINLLIEFMIINSNTHCIISILLPEEWSPEIINRVLNPLLVSFQCNYQLNKKSLVLSSFSPIPLPESIKQIYDENQSLTSTGVNFISKFEVSGPIFDYFQKIFGSLPPLIFTAGISPEMRPQLMKAVAKSSPITVGILSFKDIYIEFNPETKMISLKNHITLNIDNRILEFDGGGSSSVTENIILSYRLINSGGQSTSEVKNSWDNPFGIQGISIHELGASLGLDTSGSSVGLQGIIAIGKSGPNQVVLEVGGKIINGSIPTALIASMRSNSGNDLIPLTKIIKAFTLLPLPRIPLLDQIGAKELTVYLVSDPNGFVSPIDPSVVYHGLSMHANISIFGLTAMAHFEFLYDRGIKAQGQLGIIELGNILKITDISGLKGPFLLIDTTNLHENEPAEYMTLSAKVTFLKSENSVSASVIQGGFKFQFNYHSQQPFRSAVSFSQLSWFDDHEDQRLTGTAGIDLSFGDRTIDITVNGVTLGSLRLFFGSVNGKLELKADETQFLLTTNAKFSTWGLPDLVFDLTITQAPENFDQIFEAIFRELSSKIQNQYQAHFSDPAKFLEAVAKGWLKIGDYVFVPSINDMVFPELIADKLRAVYSNLTAKETGRLLIEAGLSSTYAANTLKRIFALPDDQIVDLLQPLILIDPLYTSEFAGALHAMNWSSDKIFNKLRQLQLPTSNIVSALSFHAKIENQEIVKILKRHLDNVDNVASALYDGLTLNTANLAHLLASEYKPKEIAKALKNISLKNIPKNIPENFRESLVLMNVIDALKKVEKYDINDIVEGITTAFTLPQETIASALHKVGFSQEELKQIPWATITNVSLINNLDPGSWRW